MATVDEELHQLEKDLRQLQIEYDTYFNGGRPRPPNDTEWRVQRLLKGFAEMGSQLKYAERFRYNTLAARYAKFREVWRRRARRMELGYLPYSYSRVPQELERQGPREPQPPLEPHARATRVTLSDPVKETEKVQSLYHAMVEARSRAGENPDLNFEQFHNFLRRKTAQLRKQMHCQKVQYQVSVQDGQAKLKAKGL